LGGQAVGLLELRIASSALVTVSDLATRCMWTDVRDDMSFQEMLARHR